GMTSLLLDNELGEEQRDYVETIRSSSESLLSIINDILDFSKIEAGKLNLDRSVFDIYPCVEEALDLFSIRASEKNINLAYRISHSTPASLIGDLTRFRQVLVNLLSNALKFTSSGEVVVEVSSRKIEEIASETPNYEIHVSVKDTGIGISESQMGGLFQSFTQLDSSTTRRYGGTGLGLAISKKLCELMGGKIWVESQLNQGSTFHFTITAEAVPSSPPEYLADQQPHLKNRKVVLFCANKTNLDILRDTFNYWGLKTLVSPSLKEIATLTKIYTPKFLVVELQISDENFPDFLKEISAMELQHTHMILLTQNQQDMSFLFPSRFQYLRIPIKLSQLHRLFLGMPNGRDTLRRLQKLNVEDLPNRISILLVEDNPVNQKVTMLMLKKLGYRADFVSSGKEVLETLKVRPYNLILMDLLMPDMNGIDATRLLRENYKGSQPVIIAMTASAVKGDREKCLEAGMNDYISKPVKQTELKELLEKWSKYIEESQQSYED
ncbi:MAG: response regulator, partial [Blastocatellia bacterium]|nr:response regulator [Blastocatellia bacterium]